MGTTVWLEKPLVPKDAERVARMRRAIVEDAPRQSLIADCLSSARAGGLSGEDTYVFLAYHALLRLAATEESHIYLSDIAPVPESAPPRLVVLRRYALDVARICVVFVMRALAALLERLAYITERAPTYGRALIRSALASPRKVAARLRLASTSAREAVRLALANWAVTWDAASPRRPPALAHRRDLPRSSAQGARGSSRAA